MSIRPLPADVVAQIKSSIAITNLNSVVCELFKNSLDAGATKIDAIIDYTRGGCIVEDDGLGILPSEFSENGALGKLHREFARVQLLAADELTIADTSKLHTKSPNHGVRGLFLASLSAMSVLSVTSRHHLHRSHNMLTMHKSEVVSRHMPAPPQQHLTFNHGTRVSVRDLFGNMPVRVKQRAIVAEKQRAYSKDWEQLKNDIVALLLAWSGYVNVTVRETGSSQKLSIRPPTKFDASAIKGDAHIPWVCSILSQASIISPEDKDDWVAVGASTPNLKIHGAISLDPSATKHAQFFSFGVQPLIYRQSIIHDEINRLFSNSSFGNDEVAELDEHGKQRRAREQCFKGDGYTNKELKGVKKGVDRWPMFYINIQQTGSSASFSKLDFEDVLDDNGSGLRNVLELLQAMVLEFLTKHHFRPKAGRVRGAESPKEKSPAGSPLQKSAHSSLSSTSTPSRAEKRPRKNPRIEFDQFGTNVKLQSFRIGTSSTESVFETWSRVKSGLAPAKPTDSKSGTESSSDGYQIQRLATAPLPSKDLAIISRSSSPNPSKKHPRPLVSQTGRITRRPFDDVDMRPPRVRSVTPRLPQTLQPPQPPQPPQTLEGPNPIIPEDDDVMTWMNPVTKVVSLVNRRTGMTVPAKKPNSSPVSSALLISSRPSTKRKSWRGDESSSWINGILREWENPVFPLTEPSIPHIGFNGLDIASQELLHGRHHLCSQIDIDRAFREASSGLNGRIFKEALRNAEVMSQVDKKFILVKLRTSSMDGAENDEYDKTLVLIDQHAADERIRIESLLEELCTPPSSSTSSLSSQSRIMTAILDKPLIFEVTLRDIQLLETHKEHFANWGIIYTLAAKNSAPGFNPRGKPIQRLAATHLPPGIIERCKLDPRLLIDLIRTEVYKIKDQPTTASPLLPDTRSKSSWLQSIHTCPRGLLDMLNSRACRSAIMFNDELSKEQCQVLVRRLSECLFPFQCAHGRPTLVPLVNVEVGLRGMGGFLEREDGGDYGRSLRLWKEKLGGR